MLNQDCMKNKQTNNQLKTRRNNKVVKVLLPLSEAGTSRFHFLNFSRCARKFEKVKLLL